MKSGASHVDHAAARNFATLSGFVGAGWSLNGSGGVPDKCADLDRYLIVAKDVHPNDGSMVTAAGRIGSEIAIGDYGWMYDARSGEYWCCEITGDFVYRCGGDFDTHDLHMLRPCRWAKVGAADAVPGAIRRAFAGPFGTVGPLVTGIAVIIDAAELALGLRSTVSQGNLFDVATPDDLEDLVALFLQEKGWSIYPSTSKMSMANYEYVLVHRLTGGRAGIQVKSGNVSYLSPVIAEEFERYFVMMSRPDAKVDSNDDRLIIIDPNEILEFAREQWHILPKRLKVRWPQVASSG